MLSIGEALKLSVRLESHSDSSRIDCEVILSAAINNTRTYLYTWPEKNLTDHQESLFLKNLARRIKGEPVAYIVGQKEFWSLPLFVDESTLIPRPETELLVEVALELLDENSLDIKDVDVDSSHIKSPDTNSTKITIADLGTGTGAVALALASENPRWQVWGLEKNEQALALAKKNQQHLEVSNVNLLLSDWFSVLTNQKFTMIVSNPPYIDVNDKHLKEGDVRFEPASALVADNHGMADIDSIIKQAEAYLLPCGWLVFEHGNQQADVVTECFNRYGFMNVFTRPDLAGRPRITAGQLR